MGNLPERRDIPDAIFLPAFIALSAFYCSAFFLNPSSLLSGDTYYQIYPLMDFFSRGLKSLEFPLWNPYEFAGLPFPGQMQTGAFYPPNILLYRLLPPLSALNWGVILHMGLGGWFMFVYLRGLGLSRAASFAGGCAYSFIGQFPMSRLNIAHMNSAAWIPLIFHYARSTASGRGLRHVFGLSAAVAFQMFAGGTQMCLYTYMAIGIYCVILLAEKRRDGLKPAALIALGILPGLAASAGHIAWSAELSGLSVRDGLRESFGAMFIGEFATRPESIPSLIFPLSYSNGAFGGWKTLSPSGFIPVSGLSVLAFGLPSVFSKGAMRDNRKFWIIVSLFVSALIIIEATPASGILYNIPVLGSFRVHGRSMILVSAALSVFTAFTAESLIKGEIPVRKLIRFPLALLCVSLAAAFLLRIFAPEEASRAFGFTSPGVLASIFIFLLSAVALRISAGLGARNAVVPALIVLSIEALVFYAPPPADGKITAEAAAGICAIKGYDRLRSLEKGNPVRIADIRMERYADGYNVPCKAGRFNAYDQLMLSDYARLFDLEQTGSSRYWDYLLLNNTLLSMMNVRYIYATSEDERLLNSITAAMSPPSSGSSLKDAGVYLLSPPEDGLKNIINRARDFEPGVYLLTLSARAYDGAFLRAEMYTEETRKDRFMYHPMNSYPGRLGREPEGFQRIFVMGKSGPATMTLISTNFKTIEVSGITLSRLQGYGPMPLNENVMPGAPVYAKAFEADGMSVYENRNALPRAFSISRIVPAKDINEMRKAFELNSVNPSEAAFMYEADIQALVRKDFAKGGVRIKDYGANSVLIDVSFGADGFVVLSDQYYPGWRAYIDGEETGIFRVNGVMRGVAVSGGRHEIVFLYRPRGLIMLALSGVALLAVFIGITIYAGVRESLSGSS